MKKNTKLKRWLSSAYKKIISAIFRFAGSLAKFAFLFLLAAILFIIANFHYIALASASLWCGYHMWNEYGKAMAIFSFFVLMFLGCIVVNTEKKDDANNRL